MSIASETEGTTIRYTINGEDPNESSPVYSEPLELAAGTTLKAQAFDNSGVLAPSDISKVMLNFEDDITPNIPIGTELSDGFIIYDRGEVYGSYILKNGILKKVSTTIESISPDSMDWRFLIAAKEDLKISGMGNSQSYSWSTSEEFKPFNTEIGYGWFNTEGMIDSFNYQQTFASNLWVVLIQRRRNEGLDERWFVPSLSEIERVYSAKEYIGNFADTNYWTSSLQTETMAFCMNFNNGVAGSIRTNDIDIGRVNIRLIRRI